MAPLYLELKDSKKIETKLCITSQHKQMLKQILSLFNIKPDFDLDVMSKNQNLFSLTAKIINKLKLVFDNYKPDFVLVHGDTTTGMAAALASFYNKSTICHVEAGLRTYDKFSPFPEEINRQLISSLSDYHFCPTKESKKNLINENINEKKILITGNTVIDSLMLVSKKTIKNPSKNIKRLKSKIGRNKILLVTAHRRENHGDGIIQICKALIKINKSYDNLKIIFPVHLNPNIYKPVKELLKNKKNIILTEPLDYEDFVWMMSNSYIIISDSGGVQEEAPTFKKPVLVLRKSTERPEALKAGTVILTDNDKNKILNNVSKLMNDKEFYSSFTKSTNPYGDGKASIRIRNFIESIC